MFCEAAELGRQAGSLMTVNIKPLHSLILLSSQSGWENHSSASERFFYTLSCSLRPRRNLITKIYFEETKVGSVSDYLSLRHFIQVRVGWKPFVLDNQRK